MSIARLSVEISEVSFSLGSLLQYLNMYQAWRSRVLAVELGLEDPRECDEFAELEFDEIKARLEAAGQDFSDVSNPELQRILRGLEHWASRTFNRSQAAEQLCRAATGDAFRDDFERAETIGLLGYLQFWTDGGPPDFVFPIISACQERLTVLGLRLRAQAELAGSQPTGELSELASKCLEIVRGAPGVWISAAKVSEALEKELTEREALEKEASKKEGLEKERLLKEASEKNGVLTSPDYVRKVLQRLKKDGKLDSSRSPQSSPRVWARTSSTTSTNVR